MKAGLNYPGVAVSFFCHDGNGNFVFHKRGKGARAHHGTWDNGGGGMEHGETIEEALFRELKEEYTCEGIIEERLSPICSLTETEDGLHHWVVHPFIIKVDPKEVTIGEPHMMEEITWFNKETLPEILHRDVLDQNKEIFKKYFI